MRESRDNDRKRVGTREMRSRTVLDGIAWLLRTTTSHPIAALSDVENDIFLMMRYQKNARIIVGMWQIANADRGNSINAGSFDGTIW